MSSTVESLKGDLVTLERTGFYTTRGGQPNDMDIIRLDGGEAQAVDVLKKSGAVLHRVKGSVPYKRFLFTA